MTDGEKLLLSPEEAARRLSISRTEVYRLMRAGELPFVETPGRNPAGRKKKKIRTTDLVLWVRSLAKAQAERVSS